MGRSDALGRRRPALRELQRSLPPTLAATLDSPSSTPCVAPWLLEQGQVGGSGWKAEPRHSSSHPGRPAGWTGLTNPTRRQHASGGSSSRRRGRARRCLLWSGASALAGLQGSCGRQWHSGQVAWGSAAVGGGGSAAHVRVARGWVRACKGWQGCSHRSSSYLRSIGSTRLLSLPTPAQRLRAR
jgi:hypothetical protein